MSSWSELELPLFTRHLSELKKDGLATASIRLLVIALKIFYRHVESRGRVSKDQAEALLAPKVSRSLTEPLNEIESAQLIESISTNTPLGMRDA